MQRRVLLSIVILVIANAAFAQSRNLDYYLERGLANNPLLNDFRNQALSAQSDSLLARSAQKPLIEGNTFLQYSPYGNHFGYDEVITDGGNYSALVGISQSIFNSARLANSISSASILKQEAVNSFRVSSLELKKMITAQFLEAYSDFTDLKFNKSFLDLYSQEAGILEQLVVTGSAKQTDLISLQLEERTQEILVKGLKSKYKKDILLLNQLCGISDTTLYELEEPSLTISGSKDVSKDPSFLKYRIDSLKIGNEIQSIDLRYKPSVKWFADAGMLTSNPWNFYNHFGFSAGLSLNIPIYDGNQRNIEKGKLAYQENSRQRYQANYKNQYYMQVKQLEDEIKALDGIEADLKEHVRTSELLVKSLKNQLEAGITGITEYISAVRNLRTSGRDMSITGIQKLLLINELNFLLKH
jgi:outer membrane protein TolC